MCALVIIILLFFPSLNLIESKIVCEISHNEALPTSGSQAMKQMSALFPD